jgi:hypothetical protein
MSAIVIDSKSTGTTHYRALVENDHLGQWDLMDPKTGSTREATVVIESVRQYAPPKPRRRRMADGSYRPEKLNKFEFRFVGKRKSWISGPATQEQIARVHGSIIQRWVGKKITLYVDPDVMMGRAKVGGIRVRSVAPTEEPTEDPLDNEVNERLRAIQDEAFGREPGEEG